MGRNGKKEGFKRSYQDTRLKLGAELGMGIGEVIFISLDEHSERGGDNA